MAATATPAAAPCGYRLTDLPSDVLVLILEYLPLLDLSKTRLVCLRLQQLVDASSSNHLWANTPLHGLWVSLEHQAIIQRAANCGNVEALIKLAVAYLYSEGVSDGPGKGTADAINGIKATDFLCRAERLLWYCQPFSWVLIRPPWASNLQVCCKACVCNKMKERCENAGSEAIGLPYSIGKTLSLHDSLAVEQCEEALEWFERGAENRCPNCTYELWKAKHKSEPFPNQIHSVRMLRQAASLSGRDFSEAQFELCGLYADGWYGGLSKQQAYQVIRETMASARPVVWADRFSLQSGLTPTMRYILIDWLVEVTEMKELPSPTVHLAVSIVDRYMLHCRISRVRVQLLGITALLLASRWMGVTILTVREASWLTDNTYKYEEVVRMMGELVAVLVIKGGIRKSTIADYLGVQLRLIGANSATKFMAYYLSELLLPHMEFGRFTASHLAAACLLNARIFLGHEYPWPSCMFESTGFTVTNLRKCCLMIYDRCLTEKYSITDHREVKLQSITNRFADQRFHSISTYKVPSYKQLKECLGLEPESPCPLLTPAKPKQKSKLLSFLNDSCYLTPSSSSSSSSSATHHRIGSGSESGCYSKDGSEVGRYSRSESELGRCDRSGSEWESGLEESLIEQLSTHRLSTSSVSPPASSQLDHDAPLQSPLGDGLCPSPCSSRHVSAGGSFGFPQPTFSDCECSSGAPSPVHQASGACLLEERMEDSSFVGEFPAYRESLSLASPTTSEDLEFNLFPSEDLCLDPAPVNQLSNFEPTPSDDRLNPAPVIQLSSFEPTPSDDRLNPAPVNQLSNFEPTPSDDRLNPVPVNQLSNFEPTPSDDPRLNRLSRKTDTDGPVLSGFGLERVSGTLQENTHQTDSCVRLNKNPELEQQHGLRKVLQPLDNVQQHPQPHAPRANLKPVERRLAKGNPSSKIRRNKKARVN